MKAEERKQIETNSIVLAIRQWRQSLSARTVYYWVGTIALVVGGVLIYRYFSSETRKARDAVLLQLASADTTEKLKQGMEDHRGTVQGSMFKLHLARHLLKVEGLPRMGTDSRESLRLAANSVDEARKYYLELTGELKEKDEPALVQEAWVGAAEAEEALVGLPATAGVTDSRGSADKAIEYWQKAGSIFPESEFSKKYAERAEMLKGKKDQFVANQKVFYAERPTSPLGGSGDPLPRLPDLPKGFGPIPGLPSLDAPPAPKGGRLPDPLPPAGDPKETPAAKPTDPGLTPDPKPADPPPADPKAK